MAIAVNEMRTEHPIQDATQLLTRVKQLGETKILVALSGGKDSLVTLDLCIRVFGEENTHPFHLWWVKDLECEQHILRKVVARYPKLPKIEEIPHYGLPFLLKACFGRSLAPSVTGRFASASLYKSEDSEKIARYRSGARWIAGGHRISDSLHRRGMLHKCAGFWQESEKTHKPIQRVYPIYRWSHEHVFAYLKARKLPIPDMFGNSVHKASGVNLRDPIFIQHIKQHYPTDFAKIKRIFPSVEESTFRDMVRASCGIRNKMNLETGYGQ